MAILRSTFIIDKEGVLHDVMYGVTPEGHAQEVLEKINNLVNPKPAEEEAAAEE